MEHYSAKDEASWKLRFHAQIAGCTLQDKVPELNLAREALEQPGELLLPGAISQT